MDKVILVRYEEIFLKGLNRHVFERQLIENMKAVLEGLGNFKIIKTQGRIYVESKDKEFDFKKAISKLVKVFGIASVSLAVKVQNQYDLIREYALKTAMETVRDKGYNRFKVESRRADKTFPIKSPELSKKIGGYILKNINNLKVDVHNPDFVVQIEVRESAYIYSEIIYGCGGLPVRTGGKAMLLLSGGIDSPVAGWMIAKRGVEIEAVHFYSYPYTSERSKEKVEKLASILSEYCMNVKLHIVPFTDIQVKIHDMCPKDHITIIMRRFMMRIAEKIALRNGAKALITGESIGQVASQTMEALVVTNSVVKMPVFRPLIGMDKQEVVNRALRIGTYETSILPYDDCCTVFVAKHPKTRPNIEETVRYESVLDIEKMISEAVNNIETI